MGGRSTEHHQPSGRSVEAAGRFQFQGLERSGGDVERPRGAPGQGGLPDAGGVGAARAVLDGMARTYSPPPLPPSLLLPPRFASHIHSCCSFHVLRAFVFLGAPCYGVCSCSHPCFVLRHRNEESDSDLDGAPNVWLGNGWLVSVE